MSKKGFLIVSLVFLIIFSLFFSSYYSYNFWLQKSSESKTFSNTNDENSENLISIQTSSKKEIPKPENLYLNSLFFGDVFWGRRINKWSEVSELKTAYPFSGLNTMEREKYDVWIADLECPSTDQKLTDQQEEIELKFNCDSSYLPEAAKWFDAFTLANNHMDNMEEFDGFAITQKNLQKNNIQHFGHFDNAKIEDLCEVVSFKTRKNLEEKPGKVIIQKNNLQESNISENIYERQDKEEISSLLTSQDNSLSTVYPQDDENNPSYYIPMAMCGFHNVFKLPKEEEMAIVTEYSKYFPTIVMPHQGKEYTTFADGLQNSYSREMIDLGADAVLGNHPHSVQNTESYKNKLIVYSMGNFIFDQQSEPLVTQGIGVNLDFTFKYDQNMDKIQEFAKSCQKFKDNCLQKAKDANLQKPKFEIKYDIIATDNANKLAKKATPEVQQTMLKRTNWVKTLSGLEEKS